MQDAFLESQKQDLNSNFFQKIISLLVADTSIGTMRPLSSSSLPPRKPRRQQTRLGSAPAHTLSPKKKHVQTKPRRTEIAYIDNLSERRTTFSKRRQGLFKKAHELCELTGAKAAVIVFSETGTLYSFGNPSVEEIISNYLRRESDVMSMKGPRDWLEWALKKCDSCATKEDFESLFVASLDWVRKHFRDLENNASVKAGAGDDSEVEGCHDSSVLNGDEIDFTQKEFQSFLLKIPLPAN